MKTFAFAVVLMIGLSSCGEDFLTAYPTDSQETGGEATKGAIEANVASAYQILLFDSYADFQFNSIVLMS
ncbi:MAG: RagB/SusD family nutrient uptake outer membrane protein, partial [Bacteroidota bacterium]